jgi:hypothetical protein
MPHAEIGEARVDRQRRMRRGEAGQERHDREVEALPADLAKVLAIGAQTGVRFLAPA